MYTDSRKELSSRREPHVKQKDLLKRSPANIEGRVAGVPMDSAENSILQ